MTENKEPTATKFMTEDTNNNYPADPAWDYYIPWHSLIHIRTIIDQGLTEMKDEEYAEISFQAHLKRLLAPVGEKFAEFIDSLPDED